jgi:Leucine-rich repeat (LRR) protein
VLNASHNAVVGTLPPALGAAPVLEVLSLASNRLAGTLPATLFGPPPGSKTTSPPLRLLDVSFNRLAGTLPLDAIAGHGSLAVLDVSHNRLSGRLPEPPPSARVWVCSGNGFMGGLTHSGVSRAPLLRHLDVSDNALSGQVPSSALLHLSRLAHLNLSSNAELGGHLPCGSGNATLDAAEMESVLAGAWTQLTLLDVSRTALSGTLCPALFRPGAALTHLDVSRNALSGTLPSDGLAQVKGLEHLDVSHNQLSGTLSPALGALGALTWFSAASNALTGQVPLALTTMPQLRHVDLSNNGGLSWHFLPTT